VVAGGVLKAVIDEKLQAVLTYNWNEQHCKFEFFLRKYAYKVQDGTVIEDELLI